MDDKIDYHLKKEHFIPVIGVLYYASDSGSDSILLDESTRKEKVSYFCNVGKRVLLLATYHGILAGFGTYASLKAFHGLERLLN